MADTTLSSSAVNSGTPVNLGGTEISVAHGNFVKSPAYPGKLTTTDAIGEVDFLGWNNPTIVVQGVINDKAPITNSATVSLLKDFVKDTSGGVYIKDDIFFTSYQKIQLDGLKMSRNARDSAYETGSITKGNMVNYSVNAILTE